MKKKPKIKYVDPARQDWKIEYEVPPTRGIFLAYIENVTAEEARKHFLEENPLARIRKLWMLERL